MSGSGTTHMHHTYYACPANCDKPNCIYCQGGLAVCTTCTAAEGEIPTDCPGRAMTDEEKQAVMEDRLDYAARTGWTK